MRQFLLLSQLAFLMVTSSALAADPVVSNVRMAQRLDDSGLADIYYDVVDADSDTMAVALQISDDDGVSWFFPCPSVEGDVGPGVVSGTGKNIIWNLGLDSPENPGVELLARVVASDAGIEHTTHSPGKYWIMEYGSVDFSNPKVVEEVAKADVYLYHSWYLWGHTVNEELRVVEKLKAINPDLIVLAYVSAKNSVLNWEHSNLPYQQALYERTLPYWSYTTEGDTLMDWPGKVVLNILDPGCRDAITSTLAEYSQASNNQVDGIFWDYFNKKIWIAFSVGDRVEGDPDFDGDGIPMAQDPDEMLAYQAACDSLVIKTREIMGEDFIQVFNGQRAMSDSTFAALSDGVYYEIFPTEMFPEPEMATALDPDYPFNLFAAMTWPRTENGGPYTCIGNMWRNIYFDQNGNPQQINLGNMYRAVGLLTGVYNNWLGTGGNTYDWTNVEVNLGEPLAPTEINGNHYFRQYQYGTVDIYMGSGTYPNPFSYEIKINGRVVEAFDMPYHFP